MSLPSVATYFDHEDNILYQHFVNVGWFLSEDNWVKCVHSLPIIFGTSYVKVYNIEVPKDWLRNHETDLRELYQSTQATYLKTRDPDNITTATTVDTADKLKMLIPMIRRAKPDIIAQNIVGVQPMMSDSSLVFQMRTRYSSNKYSRWIRQQFYTIKHWFNYQYIFVKSIINYYLGPGV